jgi:hypothetical protein
MWRLEGAVGGAGVDSPGRALCRAVYQAAAAVVDQLGPGHDTCVTIPPIILATGAHP